MPFTDLGGFEAAHREHTAGYLDLQTEQRVIGADYSTDEFAASVDDLGFQLPRIESPGADVLGDAHRGLYTVAPGHVFAHRPISFTSTTSASMVASSRCLASAMIAAGVCDTFTLMFSGGSRW
jgi:hypothetical protein